MARVSILFGLILIILGLYSYFGVSTESITALIPAFVGVVILILGVIGLKEKNLKHTMHIAAVLMLIAFIGSARGFIGLPELFSGTAERPWAIIAQVIMGIIALIFLIMAIRSFIDARKKKEI